MRFGATKFLLNVQEFHWLGPIFVKVTVNPIVALGQGISKRV
jgi:hypothetical protein